MNHTVRWACESTILYAVLFWPVASLVNDNPGRIWDLAIPSLVFMLLVIGVWRRLIYWFNATDSFGNLFLAMFLSMVVISITTGLFWILITGALTSDLGEIGGAILLLAIFSSTLFSSLALLPAFILPRLLDPGLPLRLFSSVHSRSS